MQIAIRFLLVTAIAVVVANCASSLNARADDVGQESAADKWAEHNYPIVLNKLLPTGEVAPDRFPKNLRWIVTVRILPPLERPEYRFSVQKAYDGKVEVSVTAVKGSSILSQLRTLRRKYPNASLEEIASYILVEQELITQSQSQLSRLADEFEAINMSPVLPDELRADETGYEFWSQSLWGNRMNITLSGPGPEVKKQPYPLLQWAEAVRSSIGTHAKG